MGQWMSNMLPEGMSQPSTPRNTRLSSIDPRSPTTEIDRTPIQLEGTPQRKSSDSSNKENAAPSTPSGVRERPRTLHQKLVEEKRKKLELEGQTPAASSS